MNDLVIHNNLIIPSSVLEFKYSRSAGKGGQNVNKVSTKVELEVNIDLFETSDEIKQLLKKNLHHRIIRGTIIRIVSQESRSQWKNKQIVIGKLEELVKGNCVPESKRIKTKPLFASKQKRIERKKKKGIIKSLRNKRIVVDD